MSSIFWQYSICNSVEEKKRRVGDSEGRVWGWAILLLPLPLLTLARLLFLPEVAAPEHLHCINKTSIELLQAVGRPTAIFFSFPSLAGGQNCHYIPLSFAGG